MSELTGKKTDLMRIIRVTGMLIFVMFASLMIPYFLGLGRSGFDDPQILQILFFYGIFGAVSSIIILLGSLMQLWITKGDERYGSSILFNSPGESTSPSFLRKLRTFSNPIGLLMISILIFGTIGIVLGSTSQSFTGSVLSVQQFTPGEELGFKSFLIPGVENLGGAAVIVVIILIWTWFARKSDLSRISFLAGQWAFIIIGYVLYWIANHQLRYGSSDISIFGQVAPFGLLIAILTLFTGSFIPGWVAHISNNFFYEAFKLFSNDITFVFSIGLLVALLIVYFIFFGFLGRKKDDKK